MNPKLYDSIQYLFDDVNKRRRIIGRFINSDDIVLDLGCGSGLYIPMCKKYIGIDKDKEIMKPIFKKAEILNKLPKTIHTLNKKFKLPEIVLIVSDITSLAFVGGLPSADVVLLMDVLHHLNDEDADLILKEVAGICKRILIMDSLSSSNWLMKLIDRGKYMRNLDGLMKLVGKYFKCDERTERIKLYDKAIIVGRI